MIYLIRDVSFNREFALKDLNKYLTKSEILDLLDLCYCCSCCKDEKNVSELLMKLNSLTPFDCFTYAYARSNREVLYSINVDYPMEYLMRYFDNPGGHPKSPTCGHLKIPHPEGAFKT